MFFITFFETLYKMFTYKNTNNITQYTMKDLTLSQAMELVENIACESLNKYNSEHPENNIEPLYASSYKFGVIQVMLACLLSDHENIEDFINRYKHLLPMDITKDE